MSTAEEAPISLIILVIGFYFLGLCIAVYIRVRKIYLIKEIKKTGRVISLSSTILSILMQQIQEQRRPQLSPSGLPPPPPYTIEPEQPPPRVMATAPISELPPPYMVNAPAHHTNIK